LTAPAPETILKALLDHQPSGLDDAFRALADPTRRAIVERLSRGQATVSDLAAPLPMSLAAVHQHLQVLAASGLITWEKRGRVRWCRLEGRRLRAVEDWMLGRRLAWERRLDALGTHLQQDAKRTTKSRRRSKRRP
jgi:DNA-binding transcriptional ArsR family regulator